MSTIKLEIDGNNAVQIEAAAAFFAVLRGGSTTTQAKQPELKQEAQNVEKIAEAVKKSEQKAEPVQETPEQEAPSVTLQDIRDKIKGLTTANREHMPTIKAELTKAGVNNASTLGEEHYDAFFEFLNTLG